MSQNCKMITKSSGNEYMSLNRRRGEMNKLKKKTEYYQVRSSHHKQRHQHQIKMLNKLIPFIAKLLHIIHEVGEEGSQDQEGVEEWDVAEE